MMEKIKVDDFTKLVGQNYNGKLVAYIIGTLNYCVYIPFFSLDELEHKIITKCLEIGWDTQNILAIHSPDANLGPSRIGTIFGSCLIVNNHTSNSFADTLRRIIAVKAFL